jgi:hypothetical protein
MLEFFDDLSPKNFQLLKESKKNYADCIRQTKFDILKTKAIAL